MYERTGGKRVVDGRRRQHLLNGRRVQVLDLIEAGLIGVGDSISYKRLGEEFVADIDRRGHVDVRGRGRYKTLSGAARALSGTHVDGWRAWTVMATGKYLDALRQELLETRAAQPAPAEYDVANTRQADDDLLQRRRHEFLREARDLATGEPRSIQVRDLLALWAADSRDASLNDQIEADLSNYGLGTDPRFSAVALDERIALRLLDDIPHKETANVASVADASPADDAQSPPVQVEGRRDPKPQLGVTVGTLRAASAGVEHVKPGAAYDEAITKMLINDYSQLAVMTGPHTLKGAVSWRSIARARHANPDAPLAAAVFQPREFPYFTDLIDALPTLDEEDFFFVRSPHGAISGIVTAADVVSAYRDMASPFLMLGEIDQMLRGIVEVTFDSDTIAEVCDPDGSRSITSVTQLTMGDYKQILDHPDRWSDLEWPLDRRTVCDRLDIVREFRYRVMHFNSDPVSENTLQMLRHFILVLREYGTS